VRRLETETAVGVRLERGGKSALIAFRKAGVEGQAAIDGRSFAEPVLVEDWR
jgi:hypothetical protein